MAFTHFNKDSINFLEDLAKNNNKEWFEKNRSRYETTHLSDCKQYVEVMGERLKTIAPNIKAIPKVDKSIIRLYKDVRFHKGAPFKTHQGIILWEGSARLESSCFYFHIEPPFYSLGVGMAYFTHEILAEYRNSVVSDKYGGELEDILKNALKNHYTIGGKKRKKLPKGFTDVQKRQDLLKYDYIYLTDETPINADFYSNILLDNIFDVFSKMLPFHKWLTGVAERAETAKPK